jgi:hypothetical protein
VRLSLLKEVLPHREMKTPTENPKTLCLPESFMPARISTTENAPWMPLAIERHGDEISIAHYGELNGSLSATLN